MRCGWAGAWADWPLSRRSRISASIFSVAPQPGIELDQNGNVSGMQVENAAQAFQSVRQTGDRRGRFGGTLFTEGDQKGTVARRTNVRQASSALDWRQQFAHLGPQLRHGERLGEQGVAFSTTYFCTRCVLS